MQYVIYKITNKLNSKIYIGAHKTVNINDGYMGSGTGIKRAIKKYGVENFEKEILFSLNSEQEMYDKEAEIVTEDFIKKSNVYNMKTGGMRSCVYSQDVRNKISSSLTGRKRPKEVCEKLSKSFREIKRSDEFKKKISNTLKGVKKPSRTDEHKKAISLSKKNIKLGPMSDGHRENLKRSLNEKVVCCCYCKQEMTRRVLSRFHDDKCKENKL